MYGDWASSRAQWLVNRMQSAGRTAARGTRTAPNKDAYDSLSFALRADSLRIDHPERKTARPGTPARRESARPDPWLRKRGSLGITDRNVEFTRMQLKEQPGSRSGPNRVAGKPRRRITPHTVAWMILAGFRCAAALHPAGAFLSLSHQRLQLLLRLGDRPDCLFHRNRPGF